MIGNSATGIMEGKEEELKHPPATLRGFAGNMKRSLIKSNDKEQSGVSDDAAALQAQQKLRMSDRERIRTA